MQKKGGNISLSSYDDIFSTEESRTESTQERVQEIPLSQLYPFEGHPFKVVDDEAMMKTAESIAQFGVMTPAIARPRPETMLLETLAIQEKGRYTDQYTSLMSPFYI